MIVIVDLDNCISDDTWRLHLIGPEPTPDDPQRRYCNYHSRGHEDRYVPLPGIDTQDRGLVIVVFTARPDLYRGNTELWMSKHGLDRSAIYMRQPGDHRGSVELKHDYLHALLRFNPKTNIFAAFDDRQDVVDMYNQHGITGIRVAINEQQ